MSAAATTLADDVSAAEATAIADPQDPPLGTVTGLSGDEYHEGPGVSRSDLSLIARSPAHYRYAKANPREANPEMNLGESLHRAILDGLDVDTVAVRAPEGDKRTKAIREAWKEVEESAAGRFVLRPGQFDALAGMTDALRAHPSASLLLKPDVILPERSHFWIDEHTGLLCKCRPDAWNTDNDVIVDLKTTVDASPAAFGKSISNYFYHVQNAWYLDGMSACDFDPQAFVFVAVESSPPYGVAVYTLTTENVHKARVMYQRLLEQLAVCLAHDRWPAYSDHVQSIDLPPWAFPTPT